MEIRFVEEKLKYDGSQLSSHFALKKFSVQGDSILVFKGPMDIEENKIADLEDLLAGKLIRSGMMLHFIVELFNESLECCILKQRILVRLAADIISNQSGVQLTVKGDDLYIDDKKLSVSIAAPSPVSIMIHFGINISTKDVPVKAASLQDLNLAPDDIGRLIADSFKKEMESVKWAVCKVKAVP